MDYQIREIVDSAVSNIAKAAETNTIIGKPLVTMDGVTVLPISQVSFAYFAGAGDYGKKQKHKPDNNFAGGSGGGATLTPVGFLVIDKEGVRILSTETETPASKILDIASKLFKAKS
ncbi:MAG: hypothetical protein IJF72_00675 [Clostridia bacterium]|nr:hypothetical protein [Clostridia bacterium]